MNQAQCKAKALELMDESSRWNGPTSVNLVAKAQVYATLATIPDIPVEDTNPGGYIRLSYYDIVFAEADLALAMEFLDIETIAQPDDFPV